MTTATTETDEAGRLRTQEPTKITLYPYAAEVTRIKTRWFEVSQEDVPMHNGRMSCCLPRVTLKQIEKVYEEQFSLKICRWSVCENLEEHTTGSELSSPLLSIEELLSGKMLNLLISYCLEGEREIREKERMEAEGYLEGEKERRIRKETEEAAKRREIDSKIPILVRFFLSHFIPEGRADRFVLCRNASNATISENGERIKAGVLVGRGELIPGKDGIIWIVPQGTCECDAY